MAYVSHLIGNIPSKRAYLANVPSIHTFNLLDQFKAHSFIDTHVWIPLRALEVAWHILPIGLFHDILHELLSDSHATRL